MKLSRKMDEEESQEYWEFVEKTSRIVEEWPAWMRGEDEAPKNQANGRRKNNSSRNTKKAPSSRKIEFK